MKDTGGLDVAKGPDPVPPEHKPIPKPEPDFLAADGVGQVSMKAWAGAAGVEVPEQYMNAMADEVFHGAPPHLLHQHWPARQAATTSWHDLPFGEKRLAECFWAAAIVEFKRQGFLTNVH